MLISKEMKISIFATACLSAVTVSNVYAARGGGMGGGGMGGGGETTTPIYDARFTSAHFSGSGNCKTCHNSLTDENDQDVSIETGWSASMMANASRDPVWKAKVRSEINRNPHLESVLNDKCTKCHAPMANTEAHYLGDPVELFDGGFLNPANLHFDEAIDAVSCTLCHQIADSPTLGTLEGFSGHYEIETFTNAADRKIYGPYVDVFDMPMRNNVQYSILYSRHIAESTPCATCHNLKTPYVDENGDILSISPEDEFPEQMPYSEWEHSAYVTTQSCQDCHMTRTNGVVMASKPMWINTLRDGFAIHNLAGANRLMLDILANNKSALGVTSNNFTYTIAETDTMLQGAADIDLVRSSITGGVLDFTLRLASNTGHKLPSGIPFRRVVLHVTVKNGSGAVVFESGKINGDGSVSGLDSDFDRLAVEPHYEVITSPDQVQVYEAVMADNLGEVTYTLLRAMDYLKDNRLLPTGFDKNTAPDDIKVAGNALTDQDFTGGSDEIRYHLAGFGQGRYTVTAELVFQPLSYGFTQDLSQDGSTEAAAFTTMYNASSHKSMPMAAINFTVRP